jgi:hypothetical protein
MAGRSHGFWDTRTLPPGLLGDELLSVRHAQTRSPVAAANPMAIRTRLATSLPRARTGRVTVTIVAIRAKSWGRWLARNSASIPVRDGHSARRGRRRPRPTNLEPSTQATTPCTLSSRAAPHAGTRAATRGLLVHYRRAASRFWPPPSPQPSKCRQTRACSVINHDRLPALTNRWS